MSMAAAKAAPGVKGHEICSRRGSGAPAPWRLRARMGGSCAQLGSRCLVLACSASYTAVLSRSACITLLGLCLFMMQLQHFPTCLAAHLCDCCHCKQEPRWQVELNGLRSTATLPACCLNLLHTAAVYLPFQARIAWLCRKWQCFCTTAPSQVHGVPDCAWQKARFLQRLDTFLLLLLPQLLA